MLKTSDSYLKCNTWQQKIISYCQQLLGVCCWWYTVWYSQVKLPEFKSWLCHLPAVSLGKLLNFSIPRLPSHVTLRLIPVWGDVPKALSAVSGPQWIPDECQCSCWWFCAGLEAQRWRTLGSHPYLRLVYLSQTRSPVGLGASHPPRDPLWSRIQWQQTLSFVYPVSYPYSPAFPISPLFLLIECIYRTVLDWQKIEQRVERVASRHTVSLLLTSYISVAHLLQLVNPYWYITVNWSSSFNQISLVST